VLVTHGLSQDGSLLSLMEKTLCDDCSKEATQTVKNRQFCSHCAMRVLQQDDACIGYGMGGEWSGGCAMSQSVTR
jgi:predicted amidophosphoribosyltransferase